MGGGGGGGGGEGEYLYERCTTGFPKQETDKRLQ